jgi:hypothetical protein
LAARHGRSQSVLVLLKERADVARVNGRGLGPADVALRHGHTYTEKLLRQAQAAGRAAVAGRPPS